MEKIKVGDYVNWEFNPRVENYNGKLHSNGTVVKIYESIAGSKVKKRFAKIEIDSQVYRSCFPGRNFTSVTLEKLTKKELE